MASLMAVQEPSLTKILRSVLAGEKEWAFTFYEDLPDMKTLSPDWEQALCEAIQWPDVDSPSDFLWPCCQALLNVRSSCEALPDALARLLASDRNFLNLQLCGTLAKQRNGEIGEALRAAAGSVFKEWGPFKRWLLLHDPEVKALWDATFRLPAST